MNLFDHYRRDPRGASSFNQWCEDRIWELLQRPGRLEVFDERTGRWWVPTCDGKAPRFVGECLQRYLEDPIVHPSRSRVVLASDGTVIKEWGAA